MVKKVRKMLQNVGIFWLFLRNFVAILAMKMNKIDYFWLSTVGNTVWGRTIHRRGGRTDHWCEKDWSMMWGDQLLMWGDRPLMWGTDC